MFWEEESIPIFSEMIYIFAASSEFGTKQKQTGKKDFRNRLY